MERSGMGNELVSARWIRLGTAKLRHRRMNKYFTRFSDEHVIWLANVKLKGCGGFSPDLELAVFLLMTYLIDIKLPIRSLE